MLNIKKNKIKSQCKFLYISPDICSGGAENILFNVVKSKRKSEVVLVSLTTIGFYGNQLKKNGYKVYKLDMKKDILIFYKLFKLLLLIKKYNPKVVHTWLYHANLIGGVSAKLLGIKEIFWSVHHDFEYSNFFRMIEMKLLSFLSHVVPNKIIFCSKSCKNNHIKNGYRNNISITIENGVSTNKFKPIKQFRNEIRSKLEISEDCFLLGNISRYHPIKDHDNLLKALSILNKKNINFKCILVGKGLLLENKELFNQIKKYKLFDKVILYGQTFEIIKVINALDLNIISSKRESFSMVMLENMSVGVPSISTNTGYAKRILGKSGWVVETNNPESLASCIEEVLSKKNILEEKSLIARKRAKENFSIERMLLNYENFYKKIY